jgi:hypothetical protein
MMIDRGCPRCAGALFVESFKAEGKTYVEIQCIMCSRIWTPATMDLLLAGIAESGYAERATRVKTLLNRAVAKEGGRHLIV